MATCQLQGVMWGEVLSAVSSWTLLDLVGTVDYDGGLLLFNEKIKQSFF